MKPGSDQNLERLRLHLPADSKIFVVSDLHLGDGTRSDSFQGKDEALIDFLRHVRDEGAHLIIAGDAIDFHQAWFVGRVFRAHGALFRELSALADDHRVIYIWGNHDADISFFRDVVRFDVCSSLQIGEDVIVRHGYEYDPYIGLAMDQADTATRAHHLVERLLNTWIRLPVEKHYTMALRVSLWIIHKCCLMARGIRWLGFERLYKRMHAYDHYWAQAQMGDPQGIFEGVRRALGTGPYKWIVTGHSHLPGRVEVHPDRFLVNTGSWTFGSAQYAVWQDNAFTVHDWLKKRTYLDELYKPLMDGRYRHIDFLGWWRENYMGWLRYRVAEEGRPPHFDPALPTGGPCG
jgi:UDP-2,3-diacylglucosamine pyrophosphatase LpxH